MAIVNFFKETSKCDFFRKDVKYKLQNYQNKVSEVVWRRFPVSLQGRI